jgi:hypothetical protein
MRRRLRGRSSEAGIELTDWLLVARKDPSTTDDPTLLSRACLLLLRTPFFACVGAGSLSSGTSRMGRLGRTGEIVRGFGGLSGSISLSGRLGEPGV